MSSSPSTLAIALGDPAGIGPEVSLKAIAAEFGSDDTRYLVIGNEALVRALNQELGLGLRFSIAGAAGSKLPAPTDERLQLFDPQPASVQLSTLRTPRAPEGARAAVAWLRAGASLCLRGEASALVTAPVNKESIIRSGEKGFIGQTELLSGLAGTERTAMMLLGCDDRGRWLRVALVTTHLPIARVAQAITREKVQLAIELAAQSCRDLGLPRARVGVCGLNPHAGEGGQIGTEEIDTVIPAVEDMRARGLDVVGPLAADTLFYYAFRGDYDAVVAMYHDQGLGPLKMIGFESGVNWTLGLPFIRTSPDHGTAYDIAGQAKASPTSMVSAIRLAKQLAAKRAAG
jgi:4-hydroxythreonine-4-phosphate dehydrogenase